MPVRTAFEEVPELYDRARPSYPAAILDELIELTGLEPGARLVEIGCGTGQATVSLAERGFALTCVELGEQLAERARLNLARFPRVEVVTGEFETWRPEQAGFDAVVAFSAFHWVAPELRYARSADLLRAGGSLAFVSTAHVLPPGGDPFFRDVQADYEAFVRPPPAGWRTGTFYSPPWRLPQPDALADHSDAVVSAELGASGRFRDVVARRHLWDTVYTADDYVAVLGTYSHHRAFDAETRERLFARIRKRIDERPERTVRMTTLGMLYVAEHA
jgi:SAM-dependent methyltransferase